MSSWRITACNERNTAGGALITSALSPSCAWIVAVDAPDDADDDNAPPAPVNYLVASNDIDPAMAYESANDEDNQLELLREGMASLDARSRDIIKRRWLDADSKVTLQELADEYGVSAERIRQVEANALKKMKALFAA